MYQLPAEIAEAEKEYSQYPLRSAVSAWNTSLNEIEFYEVSYNVSAITGFEPGKE